MYQPSHSLSVITCVSQIGMLMPLLSFGYVEQLLFKLLLTFLSVEWKRATIKPYYFR